MKKLNKLHVYHITGTDPKSNRKIVETRDIIENRNNIYIHISIFVDLIMLPPPSSPVVFSDTYAALMNSHVIRIKADI
jgi:hypothetical protein